MSPIARAAVDASLPGDPKADPTQQGRFLYHFDKEGPNYDVWTDEQRKEAGIDPEMQQTVGNAQGSQGVAMPTTRNIGFTLNIKF
jgi:hypothetical protein